MPVIVPVFPGEPLYQERVRLEDRDYIFRFDWSNREKRFYVSIFDQDEEPLLQGLKVTPNWDLLSRHHSNPIVPSGSLIPVDLESGGVPPTFDDFGVRVRMFYYTSDEDISEFST